MEKPLHKIDRMMPFKATTIMLLEQALHFNADEATVVGNDFNFWPTQNNVYYKIVLSHIQNFLFYNYLETLMWAC